MPVKDGAGRRKLDYKRNDGADGQNDGKRKDDEQEVDETLCKKIRFFCEIVSRCETDDTADVFYLGRTRYGSRLMLGNGDRISIGLHNIRYVGFIVIA